MRSRFRLLRRLSVANFRLHRWRWFLTLVGIAVGVASFAGILAISRSIIYAFELSVTRTAGRAQLQVSNGSAGIAADLVPGILRVPGVEAASGTVQYDVTLPSRRRRLTIFGILLGENHAYRESQFGSHALGLPDAGTFLVKTDSIALAPALQRELGLTMGSSIDVVGPKGPRTLAVRGTVQDQGALSVFGGDVGVMDAEAAQQSFGELDRFHWIDVVVAGDADVETVRHAIEAAIGARGVVETPFGRGGRMEAMLGTLRWIMTISGTVSMLVGIFLIQHTVNTAIARRRADFVKLRAIGATRWTIVLIVFVEALLVGVVGSILGIAGGLGFAKLAVRVLGDSVSAMYVSLPPPPVTLTPGELAASFALGCGAVLLATVLPGLQLLRLRPLALRTSVDIDDARTRGFGLAAAGVSAVAAGILIVRLCGVFGFAGGVAIVAIFAGLLFLGTALIVPMVLATVTPIASRLLRARWGSLGFWAWSQLVRHRFHTATTIGAIAAAVAFTIGLTTLLGSYRGAIAPWISQRLAADVFVIAGAQFSLLTGPTIAPEIIDEIKRVDGVAAAMPWRFVQVQFRDKPIIVQSIPPVLIRRWHPDVAERLEGGVIISETLAERFKLDVGDSITVPAPVQPVSVKVGAVAADFLLDLGNLTLPWDVFVQHFGDRHANILFVDAAEGVDGLDLKRRIEEQLAGRDEVTVLTGRELRDMASAMIDQSFALTGALQFLAVLVTVLAMINATTAAILDRTFDLAVWRALGLERGRLIRVLVVEATVLGFLGGVLGIAAGALLGQTFVKVVAPVVAGFRLTVIWPIIWSLVAVVLTMAFAGATASLVARSQTPRPIVLRSLRS